jgi:hypothetical protein
MYVGKYRPKYPALHVRLRSQLHLSLYLGLDLDLNRDLYPSPYRALFAKSYGSLLRQLLTTLLGSMLSLMFLQSQILSRPATRIAKLPPRRPLPLALHTAAVANTMTSSTLGPGYRVHGQQCRVMDVRSGRARDGLPTRPQCVAAPYPQAARVVMV